MKKCLEQGEDFDNWIKYLSKYMGHESTASTMYYLHMVEALIPEYQKKSVVLLRGSRWLMKNSDLFFSAVNGYVERLRLDLKSEKTVTTYYGRHGKL